jgi:AAA15 family ATPase/GTPase
MRKLTVKNFSVIKEAELEFGKITVLIGPQASGKSLLCKLAYFLGKELVELSARSISNGSSWDEYLLNASKAFWSRFSSGDGLVQLGTEVKFASSQYEVALTWGG